MTDEKETIVSQEKFDEMVKELEHLKTVRRTEIAKNLEYARALGDLSENAEYQEARDLQSATEERIKKLEELVKNTKILTDGKKKNEIRNPPIDPIIALNNVKRGIMIMPARNRGAIK